MSVFGSILDRIVEYAGHSLSNAFSGSSAGADESAAAPGAQAAAKAVPAAPAAGAATVDANAVLTQMAAQAGGGGDWRNSIVDLLKLLKLDSSLDARRNLAGELGVHAGADGSAEQNVALHKAVMGKLAENGGRMPAMA